MLVFGDAVRRESAAHKLQRLRAMPDALNALPRGIARHALLAEALIEAGELWQGAADARFHAAGCRDEREPTPPVAAAAALTVALARRCAASWLSGFERSLAQPAELLDACEELLAGESFDIRQPEGYAFYALYPEAYFMAAAGLVADENLGGCRVVGLRSIGTSLCAMVAAAVGDPAPRTVRPVGPPFERRLSLSGDWPAPRGVRHAIVDEGPGLSGSSMAAMIGRLRREGAQPGHIHLFPGHAEGPGAEASPHTRALWAGAHSHVIGFDALILHARARPRRLRTWVEGIVGPLAGPLEDISGPGRLAIVASHAAAAAPVHPWQERRKFLAHAASGAWLVKFAGLGHMARERVACARMLGDAGFSPRVAGTCHGFLVERWHGEMTPLARDACASSALREPLLHRLAEYIAFRARNLPAPQGPGASLDALARMGLHNSAEAFGADAAHAWRAHLARACELQPRVRRVRTDNRMHAWEWLMKGRTLLKTDAIDHHAGHDLVGCQDLAWDVAGAVAEFALDARCEAALTQALACHGHPVDAALLDFYRPAYLAFQLGHFRLAACSATDAEQSRRLRAHAEAAYEAPLARWLGAPLVQQPA
jgi:hypothetical protein